MINIKNLKYSISEKNIINNISLDIEKGKFYGILGPNGSGKTTFLDIILGFIEKKSGDINILDKKLESYNKKELAKLISYVPQNFNTSFQISVNDILEMGRYPYKTKFKNLKKSDREIIDKTIIKLKLDDLKDKSITELSGGERQRVIIGKALIQDTPILFLDEITSNLDPFFTHEILKEIKKRVIENNITVISVFHDFSLVSLYCDEVIFIKNGSLIIKGKTEKVFTPKIIKKVFNVKSNIIKNKNKTFVIPYL